LKRVFNIAIEICEYCGGTVKIIASIQDPAMIKTILARLATARARTTTRGGSRARWMRRGASRAWPG
jgi:hypothetical protein